MPSAQWDDGQAARKVDLDQDWFWWVTEYYGVAWLHRRADLAAPARRRHQSGPTDQAGVRLSPSRLDVDEKGISAAMNLSEEPFRSRTRLCLVG